MNNKFIVGKWYKLRNDYPVTTNEYDVITFEGRETAWIPAKQPFFDRKPRKAIKIEYDAKQGVWTVIFAGIKNGGWSYHPEDFDQYQELVDYDQYQELVDYYNTMFAEELESWVFRDEAMDIEEEVTILKKQVSHLRQILETQTIPDLIINNSNNC